MDILKNIILIIIGFSSGTIVAGGIFAFIAVIGVVPRLAQRTKTIKFIRLYEDFIILGGIFGCLYLFIDYYLPVGTLISCFFLFCVGVFVGCLAVSLAEVFNVVPVFMRRTRLKNGLGIFITVLALGKAFGSLAYFILPVFIK